MPLGASADFGAQMFETDPAGETHGRRAVHDHLFPSANTAIPHLLGLPPEVIEAHRRFSEDVVRVDLFGIRRRGRITGELIAPLRPEVPALEPEERVLIEAVVRTTGMGHHLTQGTADSNQLWLDVEVSSGGRVIARSGGVDEQGREFARGLVNYSAAEARRIKGRPSSEIEKILGYVDDEELVHRDNLVLI